MKYFQCVCPQCNKHFIYVAVNLHDSRYCLIDFMPTMCLRLFSNSEILDILVPEGNYWEIDRCAWEDLKSMREYI